MKKLIIAQVEKNIGGRLEGQGELGNTLNFYNNIGNASNLFEKVMSIIIGFLTVVAGIYFIFQFITGALGFLSAGGDKTKIQAAQAKIGQAVLGLAIVIIAIFIIDFIGTLLGLKILSPGDFIISLWT